MRPGRPRIVGPPAGHLPLACNKALREQGLLSDPALGYRQSHPCASFLSLLVRAPAAVTSRTGARSSKGAASAASPRPSATATAVAARAARPPARRRGRAPPPDRV